MKSGDARGMLIKSVFVRSYLPFAPFCCHEHMFMATQAFDFAKERTSPNSSLIDKELKMRLVRKCV